MKIFVNNQIDPTGGFFESGLTYEILKKRIGNFTTIHAMSCGSPVPNNNDQEMIETAWLQKTFPGQLIIDHWYAGTIGEYGRNLFGKISTESCDLLNFTIADEFKSFMMLDNACQVTQERIDGIAHYYSLLFPEHHFTLDQTHFSHGPERNFFLKDLLLGAKENEAVLSFSCPFESTRTGIQVKRQVRKNLNSQNGWIISKERDVLPLKFNEKIGEILTSYDLFDLQKLLGVSIHGKATFRLYHNILGSVKTNGIMIRDYSHSRGTLQQCSENFGEQLIISKRIYVGKEITNDFINAEDLLSEAPISCGDTVIFQN
jgi:hypothetical protein